MKTFVPISADIYLKEYGLKEGEFADAIRKDMIEQFLKNINNDPEYNTEEPEVDMLLDPNVGYEYQTYIQNISENQFIYYEGFSKYCWNAFKNQTQYKNKTKTQIIESFINNRATKLADEFGYKLIDSAYWVESIETMYGDLCKDYILKLNYKKITGINIKT